MRTTGVEKSKWWRHPLVVLYGGGAALLGCCILLWLMFRPTVVDVNTFWPEKGMTMDEVRAQYGPPSETHSWAEGGAHWYYYTDIGLGLTCVGVEFDEAGRVTGSWNQ